VKRTTPFDFSPPNLLGQDLSEISIGAVTPAVRLRTHFKVLSDEIDGNEPHHSIFHQVLTKISDGAVTPAVGLRTHFKVLSDDIDGNDPHHSIPRPQIYLVKIYRKSLSGLGCGSNRSVTNSLQKFSSRVKRAFQSIQGSVCVLHIDLRLLLTMARYKPTKEHPP